MHYECDYRELVAKEQEELNKAFDEMEIRQQTPEEKALSEEEFAHILEIAEMKESQYRKIRSRKKLIALYDGYHELATQARIHGGKVILDVNEDKMKGVLSYSGKEIFQTGAENDRLSVVLASLLTNFPNVWIKVENGEFTLTIQAQLYKKIQIRNLSKMIEQKNMELRKWTRQNRPHLR